jgi:hypothetical protein
MKFSYSGPALNIPLVLRQSGYHPISDYRTQHDSWVRTLGRQFYPRFHLYINQSSAGTVTFDLHLDQKQHTANIAGLTRHAGEYDGSTVVGEADRIQRWLNYAQSKL